MIIRKGVNLDGKGGRKDPGEAEVGETTLGIYCRKKIHFPRRKIQLKVKKTNVDAPQYNTVW